MEDCVAHTVRRCTRARDVNYKCSTSCGQRRREFNDVYLTRGMTLPWELATRPLGHAIIHVVTEDVEFFEFHGSTRILFERVFYHCSDKNLFDLRYLR